VTYTSDLGFWDAVLYKPSVATTVGVSLVFVGRICWNSQFPDIAVMHMEVLV
jgi:hypothetical protein